MYHPDTLLPCGFDVNREVEFVGMPESSGFRGFPDLLTTSETQHQSDGVS